MTGGWLEETAAAVCVHGVAQNVGEGGGGSSQSGVRLKQREMAGERKRIKVV